ncbi:hypothetical protein REPUB_Repub02eG0097800 [Reevesia pubescens]
MAAIPSAYANITFFALHFISSLSLLSLPNLPDTYEFSQLFMQSSLQDLFTAGYVSAHATVSGWQNDLPLGTGFGLHLGLGSKNFV